MKSKSRREKYESFTVSCTQVFRLIEKSLLPSSSTLKIVICIKWSAFFITFDQIRSPLLHTYVVSCFLITPHLKIGAYWALILFWINHPYSEVFKMVFYAVVVRLEPAQSRIQAAVISHFSVFLSKNAVKNTEKREITATWILLCTGSRRAATA